ncbi:hypothetical protein [Streptomyces sp. NPDC059788]|uniref:hypothetical protein n=1 Tax=Streptomyces sp. NPDC059788 TaxID=3346948 RepID=UPI00365883C7
MSGELPGQSGPATPRLGGGQRPALRYPPVQNGLDYLLDVTDRLAAREPGDLPGARTLKYAVLHLQAATEVLLKARLQQEHWSLVFKEPQRATRAAFDSADFLSCTAEDAFTRLQNIAGLPLADSDLKAVKKLARDRNALMHYGLTSPAAAVEARAAAVLNFLLPFLATHLLPGLDAAQQADAQQALGVVRAQLRGIEAFLTARMNALRAGLETVAATTVVCPQCAQPALVLGGDLPTCRFCLMTWDDPGDAAGEYLWIVQGEIASTDPDPDNPLQHCPDCSHTALVMTARTTADPAADRHLCFSCATDFTDTPLAACRYGCGRLLPSDAEELLCSECTGLAFERI